MRVQISKTKLEKNHMEQMSVSNKEQKCVLRKPIFRQNSLLEKSHIAKNGKGAFWAPRKSNLMQNDEKK